MASVKKTKPREGMSGQGVYYDTGLPHDQKGWFHHWMRVWLLVDKIYKQGLRGSR